ncbi:hypothetical protein CRE_16119 [Caenorhabditis remanei]|uniref:Uncharacterized protein n=1 Tax=Caenorhabditis remanei TaxID=31234 RepID=E3MBX7_CAERE|nr:hypothetical protein CRE_16119 [Caenorhabditis remanei]
MSTTVETTEPTQLPPQPPQLQSPTPSTNPSTKATPDEEASKTYGEIWRAVEETAKRSEALRKDLVDQHQAGQEMMKRRLEELESQLEQAPQQISEDMLKQLEKEAEKLVEETREEVERKMMSLDRISGELKLRRAKIQAKKEKLRKQMQAAEARRKKIGTSEEAIKEAVVQQTKARGESVQARCSYPTEASQDTSNIVNVVSIPPATQRGIHYTTNKESVDLSWRQPSDSWRTTAPRRSPAPPSYVHKIPSSSLRKIATSQIARVSVRRRNRRGSHDKLTKLNKFTIAKSYQNNSFTQASGDGGTATTSTSWRRMQEDEQGGPAAKRRREDEANQKPSTSGSQQNLYGYGGGRTGESRQRPRNQVTRASYLPASELFPQRQRK